MRRLALLTLLLGTCSLPGCFATPFVAMHDAMIGNISPAGQLRRQFFSKDFSLDIENIRERHDKRMADEAEKQADTNTDTKKAD